MDMEIVKDIIKTRPNISKKYESIKSKNIKSTAQLENIFKPIPTPLNKLIKKTYSNDNSIYDDDDEDSLMIPPKMKKTKYKVKLDHVNVDVDVADDVEKDNDNGDDSEEQDYETPSSTFTKIAYKHRNFQDIVSQFYVVNPKNIDFVYGIRKNRNGDGDWMIGNSGVTMINSMLYIKEQQYVVTRGLLELIITQKPDSKLYNEDDLKNYKSILIDTSAHKNNYSENNRVRSNRGYKYTQVISPLLKGKGIMTQVNNNPTQYSYWNDANELVDKLRLLISSQFAGNNNHINKIN